MENMRALGFNTVKLWAVWNDVEREPGRFTFDELDALMKVFEELLSDADVDLEK